MEVFAITFYLCTIVTISDISEQVCKWHTDNYYEDYDECYNMVDELKIKLDDDINTVTRAYCAAVKVL